MGKDFLKVLGKLWGRGQSQFRGVLGVKSPKISVFRGGDKGRILGDFPLYSHETEFELENPDTQYKRSTTAPLGFVALAIF